MKNEQAFTIILKKMENSNEQNKMNFSNIFAYCLVIRSEFFIFLLKKMNLKEGRSLKKDNENSLFSFKTPRSPSLNHSFDDDNLADTERYVIARNEFTEIKTCRRKTFIFQYNRRFADRNRLFKNRRTIGGKYF